MSVRIACPGCGREANVEELSLGRRGRCKQCGHVFALVHPGGGSGAGSSQATPPASAWKGEAAPGPASAADLPEQFGRYRIMRRLGMGGMGAVYLAQDVRLGRSVALKVPFFHPTEGDGAIARFEREARAAATLDHPNLCPVYDVGEVDGIHYLTMPFLEGKPLSEAMPRGRAIPEAQAAAVARKLALALAEAHTHGVIHRDLKPGNIMVSRRRDLVIMDFGLARVAGADTPLTVSGHVLGTALYMAPEQAAGDVEATGPPCDVYSLGVILYELLTGVRPFEGPWSLVIGLKSVRDPDPPSVHRPGLDPRLDAICHRAIARVPADRYQTMAEFAAALEPIVARASTLVASVSTDADADADSDPESSESLAAQVFAGLVSGTEVMSLREEKRPAARPAPRDAVPPPPRRRFPTGVAAAGFGAVLLLGIIITIATDRWRAEIKADGPNIRVDVQKQDVGPARIDPVIPAASTGVAEVVEGATGRWRVEGQELLLEGGPGENWLLFGDPNWTDYDFQFTATQEQAASGLRALFRSPEPSRIQQFNYGWLDFKTALMQYREGDRKFLDMVQDGQPLRLKEDQPVRSGQPYTLKVVVRGRTTRAYCDDRPIFEVRENRFARGRVGFGTWYGGSGRLRIKDISVKSPDGTILWDGPPQNIGVVRTQDSRSKKIPPEFQRGDWRMDGDELVQSSLGTGAESPRLIFGGEILVDYNMEVWAMVEDGTEGPIIIHHWYENSNHQDFGMGKFRNQFVALSWEIHGKYGAAKDSIRYIKTEKKRWYKLRVEVRGTTTSCYLDDAFLFKETDPRFERGRIGLATWETHIRFKNLLITSPDGEVLCQEFPELDAGIGSKK